MTVLSFVHRAGTPGGYPPPPGKELFGKVSGDLNEPKKRRTPQGFGGHTGLERLAVAQESFRFSKVTVHQIFEIIRDTKEYPLKTSLVN